MPAKPFMELHIHGVANLSRAATNYGGRGMLVFRKELASGAKRIQKGVQSRYLSVNKRPDRRGASGVRTRITPVGASVKQILQRSEDISKRRPNYGPRMMKHAFLPAMKEERGFVVAKAQEALQLAKLKYWHN